MPFQEYPLVEPKKKEILLKNVSDLPQLSVEKKWKKCLFCSDRKEHNFITRTRHQKLLELMQSDPLGAKQIALSIILSKEVSPGNGLS